MTEVSENQIASRLLEEAVRLFAHKGYPATSTREIVEAAGVTKPMLYYYFQSKEGLLAAAIAHFIDPFHERLARVMEEQHRPRALLVELVWAHLDFCQQHRPLARLFFALYFGPDDQKTLVDLEKYTQKGNELMAGAVQRSVATGLVSSGSHETFLMALHGMINIWVIRAITEEVHLDHSLAEQIVAGLLNGYRTF